MEKLVYIVRKAKELAIEECRDRLLGECADRILASGVSGLTMCVADVASDPRVDPARLVGSGPSIAATCSIWLESLDDRHPIEDALRGLGAHVDGYLVTESVPQPYAHRDWNDGERSPGITQVCAFPQPDHLTDEEFFRLWHDQHTPFSFVFHPRRWRYERNVVARLLAPGAPRFRGIVNESWPEFEDFLDMDRYVPEDLRAPSDDRVEAFIGLDALHLTVTSEYILRSFPP